MNISSAHRWILLFLALAVTPLTQASSLKEWLFKLFGIDTKAYAKLADVRRDFAGPPETGGLLEKLNILTGEQTVLWRSDHLLSPLVLRDKRITLLRLPGGDSAKSEIWLVNQTTKKPVMLLAAPGLREILGEDAEGHLLVVQSVANRKDVFELRMADLKLGTLGSTPNGEEKTFVAGALAGFPRQGLVRNGRFLAVAESGELKAANLADNPKGEFEPLGPELPFLIIDPAWEGDNSVVYVAREKNK